MIEFLTLSTPSFSLLNPSVPKDSRSLFNPPNFVTNRSKPLNIVSFKADLVSVSAASNALKPSTARSFTAVLASVAAASNALKPSTARSFTAVLASVAAASNALKPSTARSFTAVLASVAAASNALRPAIARSFTAVLAVLASASKVAKPDLATLSKFALALSASAPTALYPSSKAWPAAFKSNEANCNFVIKSNNGLLVSVIASRSLLRVKINFSDSDINLVADSVLTCITLSISLSNSAVTSFIAGSKFIKL